MNIENLNQLITLHLPVVIAHDYTIRGGVNQDHAKRAIEAKEFKILLTTKHK